jgi:hypothetical protein
MNHRCSLRLLATIATLLGAIGTAQAGPLEPPPGPIAPTMKTLDQVEARKPIRQSDLPLAIMTDGAYYLTENLRANQNGVDMINVFANYVAIDLNGFTIDGAGQGVVAADCIQIEPNVRTFSVSNGTIRGCTNGIVTNNPTALSATVDRMHVNQNGVSGVNFGNGSHAIVTRSMFRANGVHGAFVFDGIMQNCTATANQIGLQINYGVMQGCFARDNWGINALVFQAGVTADTYAP